MHSSRSDIKPSPEGFIIFNKDCWDMEKEILRKYKQYRYKGNPLLVSGNTELFSVDIFNLPQEV